MFSHQISHVLYLEVEEFLFKINQFYRIEQPLKSLVFQNVFGGSFLLDDCFDGAKPLGCCGIVAFGGTSVLKFKELVNFHENLLDFGEELFPVAHLVDAVDVCGGFLREHLEVEQAEEVDAGQLVFFAGMDLVLDDARDVIFYAVLEEPVALLLDFDEDFLSSVGRADDIQDAIFLVEDSREFLHFERDVLDGFAALQVKHRVHERDEERMGLFFRKDHFENAVAQDVGVLVEFTVLEKVVFVDGYGLEQGTVLGTVHTYLRLEMFVGCSLQTETGRRQTV